MDLVQELQFDINFEEILKITKEIQQRWCMFKAMGGCSLQHRSSVPGPWNRYDGNSSYHQFPEKTTETDFKELNQDFKNTEFERIINHFKLFRTRLMLLEQKSNYSIHTDKGWRLHLPIITNKDCRFYYSKFEKEFHLEAGKFYKVYVETPHTFFNSSNTFRIHLVAILF